MGKDYKDENFVKDREIEQGKTAGTEAEQAEDPDNVWFPGDHDYDPDHPDGGYYKLKTTVPSQFIAPIMKAIQELSAENTALKARVATLEG